MKTFPMFLQLAGRTVMFIGGSEEIARKLRLIRRTEARLVVWSAGPPVAEITALADAGRVEIRAGWPSPADFTGAALVFIATGDEAQDSAMALAARAAGAVVNVIDRPALCTAFTPSLVDRDPVVVAIGTEGTAPVLAREIRARIEAMLEPQLGALARLAGKSRALVERHLPHHARRPFWEWVFAGTPRRMAGMGGIAPAEQALNAALTCAPPQRIGHIALVGAGPGARDLLTLRALQHLQTADVIFYDRLVDPAVLEMARRDASRVFVGKEVGAHSWPQDRINAEIVKAALAGQRVVRLKSGDPSIFGRAAEELAAAREAGISTSIVPGVTAASAAAASLGRALTERGETEALVLVTGTCRPGDEAPDWGALARPGTTMALYMAVGKQEEIRAALLAAGVPAHSDVEIVASASTGREQVLHMELGDLGRQGQDIPAPAILLVRHRKAASSAAQRMATRPRLQQVV